MKFHEGQVITLPKGFFVRLDVGTQHVAALEEDVRVIIESTWHADRGPRQDHFIDCDLAAGRPFGKDNFYDTTHPRYIFAIAGDYDKKYILPENIQAENDVYARHYVK